MEQGDQRDRGGQNDLVTEQIIGACIEVHRHLGPGLLESAYAACLCRELAIRGVPFRRELPLAIEYKGMMVDCGYRFDLVVANRIVVELKAVSELLPIHVAQVLTYLRLGDYPVGLLVNFNVTTLRRGLRRLTPKICPPRPH